MNLKAALGMTTTESTRTTVSFDEGSMEPLNIKRVKREETESFDEVPTLTKTDSMTGSEKDSTGAETNDTRILDKLISYRF